MGLLDWLRKKREAKPLPKTEVGDPTPPTPLVAAPKESPAAGGGGRTEWVDVNKLEAGPIRREKLTSEQLERVRFLQKTFAEVDQRPLEEWIDGFLRETNIGREMALCELMAKAYSRYTQSHELTLEGKTEVFRVVLLRTMASEDEVLAHLDLKILTKEDALAVMRGT
jgi:hypothetical protein